MGTAARESRLHRTDRHTLDGGHFVVRAALDVEQDQRAAELGRDLPQRGPEPVALLLALEIALGRARLALGMARLELFFPGALLAGAALARVEEDVAHDRI